MFVKLLHTLDKIVENKSINTPYLTWKPSLAEANLPLGPQAPHFLSRTWRQCAVWPGLEP